MKDCAGPWNQSANFQTRTLTCCQSTSIETVLLNRQERIINSLTCKLINVCTYKRQQLIFPSHRTSRLVHPNHLTVDRRQTKQFCFYRRRLSIWWGKARAVLGARPGSTLRNHRARKVTVKPFDKCQCRNHLYIFSIINIFLLASLVGFEPAQQRYIASQKPNTLPTELSGCPANQWEEFVTPSCLVSDSVAQLSLIARKPVLRVLDQFRHKPGQTNLRNYTC